MGSEMCIRDSGSQTEPTERLLDRLMRSKTNDEFLETLAAADT